MSRILFITKPFFIEPLGIMYLSGSLKAAGHETSWITTESNLQEEVGSINPDIICYSIMTGDQDLFDGINKNLKSKFKFLSVAGGPHTTFFPECIQSSSFDAITRGESESSIVELANKFTSGSYYDVPGFWFKEGDAVHKNPLGQLIDNLDSLPFPDRSLIYDADESQRVNPIKHFIAGRGCPYACTYCFNHSYNRLYAGKGNPIRLRSVRNFLDEIKETVSKYPTKFVYFQDDTFILNKAWVREFSEAYAKEVKMPFHCHIRANLVEEETIRLLKDAGCFSVHIAVESGNERLRNEVLKRNMSSGHIYKACELLHKYGIKFMLQNILGLPTGTLEDDFETLRMNIRCRPTYAWASIFQPYPGTDLAKLSLEMNLVSERDLDNIQSSFFERSILGIPHKKEIEYLQKMFALTVENPEIYDSGLLDAVIKLPDTQETRQMLDKLYKSFRKTSDKKLYGFNL